jgi:DNA-binding NarL/FixJ family response regulator
MTYIGILEDNKPLSASITDFLEATGSYKVVFSVASYFDIKRVKLDVVPHFIMLDIHLLDGSGIDLIADLRHRFPGVQIIVITGDKDNHSLLLKAIEHGANGFLYKPIKMDNLLKVMEQLHETGSFLEPDILSKLMWLIQEKKGTSRLGLADNTELTDREYEILVLVEQGLSYKDIADKLNISYYTVNFHLKKIYVKFEVNSKIELVVKRNNLN